MVLEWSFYALSQGGEQVQKEQNTILFLTALPKPGGSRTDRFRDSSQNMQLGGHFVGFVISVAMYCLISNLLFREVCSSKTQYSMA